MLFKKNRYKLGEKIKERNPSLDNAQPESPLTDVINRKTKLNVSVIDYDAFVQSLLMKIFSSMTIEHCELDVQVFEDGITFFESQRLNEQVEHLLIFQGVMPIMSGIEILQKVKGHKNKNHIRIFMLAGSKGENEMARALKLGADDYMTKPFSITELKTRIERLIQRMM